MSKPPRRSRPVRMFVDACVWLDLIGDPCAPALIGALEELVTAGDIILVVARIILDEFAQNRARLIEDGGRSITNIRGRVAAPAKSRNVKRRRSVNDEFDEFDLKLLSFSDQATETAERIERLLATSERHDATDAIKVRAAERGVERKAPFHRPRNGMIDAILLEIYADMVARKKGAQNFAFVTHNTKDFSHPTAGQKLPHPDLADLFSKSRSRYFITLGEALRSLRPDQFVDLVIEQEWPDQPRRRIAEIATAERELFEKIWYNRHRLWREKIEQGQIEIVDEDTIPAEAHGRLVRREVWEAAARAAQRLEDRYGYENLGPWTDLEWGMLNGKLSALGWALGDEWDMLT
ncbi:MAG TPA: PIN domain-containing protein [Xanthobacteraceae bacterium]